MARITVEDCEDKVDNRFDLVLVAAQRARQISGGAPILVERDNDKNTIVALREIASSLVQTTDLNESLVQSYQRVVDVETPEMVATEVTEGEMITDSAEEILVNNGFIVEDEISAPSMFEDVSGEELVD